MLSFATWITPRFMRTLPRSILARAVWWLIWGGFLAQQLYLHRWSGQNLWEDNSPAFNRTTYAVLLLPLLVSIILRWAVLPRMTSTNNAFGVFVAGLVLAAMSGLSVSFLDVPYKEITFLVCLFGIAEYVPSASR
jgi:hypothetical protein